MKKTFSFSIACFLIIINLFSQTSISATIAYQGFGETEAHIGEAEYQIFLDNTNNILDKPIILVDAFDPGDNRDIASLYASLDYNGNNIADQLRDEGFDFVILNFPTYTRTTDNVEVNGGADFIQRNAMILTELIQQINTQKTGSEELVIIGPSMGGLISRYALRYMEDSNLAHQTRLYVSWDTPHKGANLPIGFQFLMNNFAEGINGGNQDLRDALTATINTPAAKQMLVDHYSAHLQSGSSYLQDPTLLLPAGAANFRDAFQTEIDAMGFPQQTRNITISNGSGIGAMTGSPGMTVLDDNFDVPNVAFTSIDLVVKFTPSANQTTEVTKSVVRVFGAAVSTITDDATSFSFTDGVDSAPGGTNDIQDFLSGAQGNQLLTDIINALQQSEYCFVPTLSSLAITNEADWFVNTDMGNTHTSAFDAWYIPDANEAHVTPTQNNVDFLLPEIRNNTANITNYLLANKYQLQHNPVRNSIDLVLSTAFSYSKTNIVIYNSIGQQVNSTVITEFSNNIQIPVQLNNGIYFLSITDKDGSLVKKFVVSK